MAEEKIGFDFQFGLKGDKEVKKGIEDIIRLMGSAPNAAAGLASILGRAGGLLELGAAAAPIGLAAAAMGAFAYKSVEAGEALRQVRADLNRLDHMSVGALSEGDLRERSSAIAGQYKVLGLEAGNTFATSFWERFGNFKHGAHAVAFDAAASIANLFGAHIGSYESMSPEAQKTKREFAESQGQRSKLIGEDSSYNQVLGASALEAMRQQEKLTGRRFTGDPRDDAAPARQFGNDRFGLPTFGGILPDSYKGQIRAREIRLAQLQDNKATQEDRERTLRDRLDEVRKSAAPYFGDTKDLDLPAKEARIAEITDQINEAKKLTLSTQLAINDELTAQRSLEVERVRNQNWGERRRLGLGGTSPFDSKLNRKSLGIGLGRDILGDFHSGASSRVPDWMGGGGLQALDVLHSLKHTIETGNEANVQATLKTGTPTIRN